MCVCAVNMYAWICVKHKYVCKCMCTHTGVHIMRARSQYWVSSSRVLHLRFIMECPHWTCQLFTWIECQVGTLRWSWCLGPPRVGLQADAEKPRFLLRILNEVLKFRSQARDPLNHLHIWAGKFYVSLTQARVIQEEGISIEKMSQKIDWWSRLWCIFLIADRCRSTQFPVGGTIPGQAALGCIGAGWANHEEQSN